MQIAINELELVLAPPEAQAEGQGLQQTQRPTPTIQPGPTSEQLRTLRRREARLQRIRAE